MFVVNLSINLSINQSLDEIARKSYLELTDANNRYYVCMRLFTRRLCDLFVLAITCQVHAIGQC